MGCVTVPVVGTPSRIAGSNRQRRTARIAARSRARFPLPLTTLTSSGRPSLPTWMRRTTSPDAPARSAAAGYAGSGVDIGRGRLEPAAVAAVFGQQLFERLGGFDRRFFVYFEEVDFAFRACKEGYESVFLAEDLKTDGSDFDRLFADGERFALGNLEVEVLHVPGHTPADLAYRIGDAVFVGDTLFMPDYGTARADFPGGDARRLYRSIRKLLSLPEDTRLFLCHDYKAPGRDEYRWETTVGEQRRASVHVHDGVTEEEFVAMREARDASLAVPRLLLPSIQVNIRAGRFPPAEDNGVSYLRLPIKPVRKPLAA